MDYKQRTKDILELRFQQEKTLEEISKVFNITRERVRQILVKSVGSSGGFIHQSPKVPWTCKNCPNGGECSPAYMKIFCSKKCLSEYKFNHRVCRIKTCRIPLIPGRAGYLCRRHATERSRRWRQTPGAKKILADAQRRQSIKFARKVNARIFFNEQVVKGRVKRKTICEVCGGDGMVNGVRYIDAHHSDYRFPLRVKWLCRPCHKKEHNIKKYKK